MAINVASLQYIQRWVSTRRDTVDPTLLPSANPIECDEEVLLLQSMFPPKCFDIFSPCLGDARQV